MQNSSVETTPLQVYRDVALLRQEPSFQYGLLQWSMVTNDGRALSFIRAAELHPNYLVAINLGNVSATLDFSKDPRVNRGQTEVKVVTSEAAKAGRFSKGKVVSSLTQLHLEPGDGLVLQLNE